MKVHAFVFYSAASRSQLSDSPLGFARGDLLTVLALSGWDCTHAVSLFRISLFAYPSLRKSQVRAETCIFAKQVSADWLVINSSVPWRLGVALEVTGRVWPWQAECDYIFIISSGLLAVIYKLIRPLRILHTFTEGIYFVQVPAIFKIDGKDYSPP